MFSKSDIEKKSKELYDKLHYVGYDKEVCNDLAPLVLEIEYWKTKRNAVILAHSYQTPDILFGIADYRGDSYQLSKICQNLSAEIIVFAGVRFMAETAKILNPDKIVLLPSLEAGCSLAESITATDIKNLRSKYPSSTPVLTYINTNADVKAESDIIVTSGNVNSIMNKITSENIIFLPDKFMAKNIAKLYPNKNIIPWNGKCIVHEEFTAEKVNFYKNLYGSDLHILVHTECAPEVVGLANLAGGTGDMIRYIKNHPDVKKLMLVTECGLTDRLRIEFPDREFIGSCNLCPYMKKITLDNILYCLKQLPKENIINIEKEIINKAYYPLEEMFKLSAE
ncbi:MAG: quinolinate synthase NadA [Candidatus Thorarchaeota archaeon]